MSDTTKIRILVVDDHPMVREGLLSMLLTAAELEVVGEADTAQSAIQQAEVLQPDVILLDIELPDTDGLKALQQLKIVTPAASILMVTMHENAEYVRQAIMAGAAGYILKGIRRRELIDAIQTIVNEDSVATPLLLNKSLQQTGEPPPVTSPSPLPPTSLSVVEQELLLLLANGLSNKAIATRMNWSVGTVKKYIQRLFETLNVSDRTQAVVIAMRNGLIQ